MSDLRRGAAARDHGPVLRRAIVLFVPPADCTAIDAIRQRWDPVMCGRIGAHVTLVHDVIDHERASDLVAAVAAETPPFRIRLTHADRWGPSAYGIYLHVDDPTGTVPAMQSRLAGLEHPSWARVPFRAHCTLVHGRTVDPALAEEAWSALASFEAGLELELSSVDIIELEEPAWRTVERFELCAAPVAD